MFLNKKNGEPAAGVMLGGRIPTAGSPTRMTLPRAIMLLTVPNANPTYANAARADSSPALAEAGGCGAHAVL